MNFSIGHKILIPGWADKVIANSDVLTTLRTFGHVTAEEEFKIFSMLLSDDMEIFELAINIIEEKSKEL